MKVLHIYNSPNPNLVSNHLSHFVHMAGVPRGDYHNMYDTVYSDIKQYETYYIWAYEDSYFLGIQLIKYIKEKFPASKTIVMESGIVPWTMFKLPCRQYDPYELSLDKVGKHGKAAEQTLLDYKKLSEVLAKTDPIDAYKEDIHIIDTARKAGRKVHLLICGHSGASGNEPWSSTHHLHEVSKTIKMRDPSAFICIKFHPTDQYTHHVIESEYRSHPEKHNMDHVIKCKSLMNFIRLGIEFHVLWTKAALPLLVFGERLNTYSLSIFSHRGFTIDHMPLDKTRLDTRKCELKDLIYHTIYKWSSTSHPDVIKKAMSTTKDRLKR